MPGIFSDLELAWPLCFNGERQKIADFGGIDPSIILLSIESVYEF